MYSKNCNRECQLLFLQFAGASHSSRQSSGHTSLPQIARQNFTKVFPSTLRYRFVLAIVARIRRRGSSPLTFPITCRLYSLGVETRIARGDRVNGRGRIHSRRRRRCGREQNRRAQNTGRDLPIEIAAGAAAADVGKKNRANLLGGPGALFPREHPEVSPSSRDKPRHPSCVIRPGRSRPRLFLPFRASARPESTGADPTWRRNA